MPFFIPSCQTMAAFSQLHPSSLTVKFAPKGSEFYPEHAQKISVKFSSAYARGQGRSLGRSIYSNLFEISIVSRIYTVPHLPRIYRFT